SVLADGGRARVIPFADIVGAAIIVDGKVTAAPGGDVAATVEGGVPTVLEIFVADGGSIRIVAATASERAKLQEFADGVEAGCAVIGEVTRSIPMLGEVSAIHAPDHAPYFEPLLHALRSIHAARGC